MFCKHRYIVCIPRRAWEKEEWTRGFAIMMMDVKNILLNGTKITFCTMGLIITFFTTVDLTYFLSSTNINVSIKFSTVREIWLKASWALLANMALLTLFIFQHSVFASDKIKYIFKNYGMQVIFRSAYVIATSVVLQILLKNWQYVPEIVIWKINLHYKPVWYLYCGIHTVAWILIYTGNICTDVTELLGIKQVYYSVVNLPDPNLRKSVQLKRLHAHMRHPSFLAFILIFWIYPVMSIDRLLLSIIFTLYMYIAWNTDNQDYSYQKYQYERKYHELQRLYNSPY